MKKRRPLEKSTVTKRTSEFKSDRTEYRHQDHHENVDSRVPSVKETCGLKNKSCINQTNVDQSKKDSKDSDKLKYMSILQMVRNKTKHRIPSKVKDVLSSRKRSTFKLPMKAFMTWERTERPRMCRRFPHTSRKELSTLLGLLWWRMGTGQKKVFYHKADKKTQCRERKITSGSCLQQKTTYNQKSQMLNVESPTICPQYSESAKLEINNNNSNRESILNHEESDVSLLYNKQADENTSYGPYMTDLPISQQNMPSVRNDTHNIPESEIPRNTFDDIRFSMTFSTGCQGKKRKETDKGTQGDYLDKKLPQYKSQNPDCSSDFLNVAQSKYKSLYSNNTGFKKCIPNYQPIPHLQAINAECYSTGGVQCIISDQFIPVFQTLSSSYHSGKDTLMIDSYPTPVLQSIDSSKHPSADINGVKCVNSESTKSDLNISTTYSSSSNYSTSGISSFRSGCTVTNGQFIDSHYCANNGHVDNSGISVQNSRDSFINDCGEWPCRIANPVESNGNRPHANTASEKHLPVSNTNTFICHFRDEQDSKETHTNLSRFQHMGEKDSDVSRINHRMDLLSSSTTLSGVSDNLHNMKPVHFVDYDFDDDDDSDYDDEDEFPQLVIDDTIENPPPDSYLNRSSNTELHGVENIVSKNTNKGKIDITVNRPNAAALDEKTAVVNQNVPKTTNASENLNTEPFISQNTVVLQSGKTVTYVFRKNQENVYSTSIVPSTSQTIHPQVQQSKELNKSTMPADTKHVEEDQTLDKCPPATEGESDFADVSTMCENILKQNCLVEPLGRSPEDKSAKATSIAEKQSNPFPQGTGSNNTPMPIYKKSNLCPRKKQNPIHARPSSTTYIGTPVPLIGSTATTNSGMIAWKKVPEQNSFFIQSTGENLYPLPQLASQPISSTTPQPSELGNSHQTDNKENVKIALFQDLPYILRHCQENKLSKPRIIGPLTASALESMLSLSLKPDKPVKPDELTDEVPPSKFVPGTRETYRDTGMGNVNKSGNIKRPMNAFMVWARSYRGHLTMLYPNESNKLVSQRLGDIWKKMSLEDKQPYYREADRIKRQHRKDYPDWKYKPNTPKSRTEKMGTHDVLWARFIGASEGLDDPLSTKKLKHHPPKNPTPPPLTHLNKLAEPPGSLQSKQIIYPSNTKRRNFSMFKHFGHLERLKRKMNAKSNSGPGRDFRCRRLDFCQPMPLFGDAGCIISDGSRDVNNMHLNSNRSNIGQRRKPFSKSRTTTTITTTNATAQGSQMMNCVIAAPPEMIPISSGNGMGPYVVNTNAWNAIKAPVVSQQRYSFSNISAIATTSTTTETLTVGSKLANNGGGNAVLFPSIRHSLMTNSPWNYQTFSQHPAPLVQSMPVDIQNNIPRACRTDATDLTNLYAAEQNHTYETKQLTRLLPVEESRVSQARDFRNTLTSPSDTRKSSNNEFSLTMRFPSISSASVLGDADSYVSSVLQSPNIVSSPAGTDNATNPEQPQCPPFVRVPATSGSMHMVTVPVISAETYKKLLENRDPGGRIHSNAMPLFPVQASWAKCPSGQYVP
ncbi:uncharacterized protein LOC121383285 [Gigantopelta aegis]|uniref:uncharacterized protein LOC121383285 n=1 Tax=Gigantopelta aegis TaxID=1735272 RepID=UPI001B88DA78|nr:uncharacterized protein LOC121383285 [Gigantopelta aegis]